ncbi:MAG: serine/threonine dehydratase [Gemmatimonadetes bacterium SCN 70-22]|nr:MAG: serine/threonine dehydratase [Gemmatimonadetes bacterium SCN 70-22]
MSSPWPITIDDVRAARARIAPYMAPSPLYNHPLLDEATGHGITVHVKHENFNPTGSFKVRNGLSFMTALDEAQRRRGVVAATRGNHGLGIAYAARAFGVKATICVPVGNNPDKNAGMRALGARVIEEGRDYDESVQVAQRLMEREGATLAHSTNDRAVLAGAATLSLETFEAPVQLDAMVVVVGGGSQAVGALTIARSLSPGTRVYAVQAAGASACHDSWHAGQRLTTDRADTFADGLATRGAYDLTFPTLQAGLAGFVTVTDTEIAEALRTLLRTTHTLVEGAGAGGYAGLARLAPQLAGQTVGIIISGANIDEATLRRVLDREL